MVHRLLSATVVADDCMVADAYATAFMVLGLNRAKEIQKSVEGIEIFLIFNDDQGQIQSYVSDGLAPFLTTVGAKEPK